MTPHLAVNPIACDAHGLCAELLPELIRLDDWGYPVIDPAPIPIHLEGHARRGRRRLPHPGPADPRTCHGTDRPARRRR